jgi:hypothetical protein
MSVRVAGRLKDLRGENAKLKRLPTEAYQDIHALKTVLLGK